MSISKYFKYVICNREEGKERGRRRKRDIMLSRIGMSSNEIGKLILMI